MKSESKQNQFLIKKTSIIIIIIIYKQLYPANGRGIYNLLFNNIVQKMFTGNILPMKKHVWEYTYI